MYGISSSGQSSEIGSLLEESKDLFLSFLDSHALSPVLGGLPPFIVLGGQDTGS